MATATAKTHYVLLRLLDAVTGHHSPADNAALRADVHAALGVTDEAAHHEAVTGDAHAAITGADADPDGDESEPS